MSDFYSSHEWIALKKKAYKRYGRVCMVTGWTDKDGVTLSVDHIYPRHKYPKLALKLSNVQIMVMKINGIKSDRIITDFRPLKWKAYYGFIALAKRSLQVIALSLFLFGLIVIAYPALDYQGFAEDVSSLIASLSWIPEIQYPWQIHKF